MRTKEDAAEDNAELRKEAAAQEEWEDRSKTAAQVREELDALDDERDDFEVVLRYRELSNPLYGCSDRKSVEVCIEEFGFRGAVDALVEESERASELSRLYPRRKS